MTKRTDLDLRVYLVLDRATLRERSAINVLRSAIRGGVTIVQLRDKDSNDTGFVEWALPLVAELRAADVPVVINDRIEVAKIVNAHGVHVGATDASWKIAREILGPRAIVGLSVENEAEALAADQADVDYLGVSAIYATATKTDLRFLWGLEGLQGLRRKVKKPLVAIGGIQISNAYDVIRSGADGIAVVSAICLAEDPCEATKQLRGLFEQQTGSVR